MKTLRILTALFLLSSVSLCAQSITLYGVNTSAFPTIKAKFWAFDAAGKQIRPSISDLSLTEDGVPRTITNISCPPINSPKAISSVLVIDVSGSMDGIGIVATKQGAVEWINSLPLGTNECALTSFNQNNYLNQDFTTNKGRLLNALNTLQANGGTDYNIALLYPFAGGLQITKTAKHKPVIVFLSDGQPNNEPQTSQIIAEANSQNATVYSVILGEECPISMRQISEQTGGLYFEKVSTIDAISQIYKQLLQTAQGGDPCEIEWQSDYACTKKSTQVELTIIQNGEKANDSYQIPGSSLAMLEFAPAYILYPNPAMGVHSQQVKVTAINAPFYVTNITSSNTLFDINPKSFSLAPNESISLNISYNAADSSFNTGYFEFINNICSQRYYVSAGWENKKPNVPTLKLTNPNGAEKYIVGSDTLITWEGIAPSDTIGIDYSIDNGKKWTNITKSASGLSYGWCNIPRPVSDSCLIRVSQYDNIESNNTKDSIPEIIWQKALGGSSIDKAYSIIETTDGNIVVAGLTDSENGDVTGYHYGVDYWVVKISTDDGSIIWQKALGGSNGGEQANSIIQTSDGNLVVAGYTNSNNVDVSGNHGSGDYWVVKISNDDGSIIWQKTLGGGDRDEAHSIIEASDGDLVVVGVTPSNDGDVTGNHGDRDYWVAKINSNDGSIVWQNALGGSSGDGASSIIETTDGNLVVAGGTNSNDGDVYGNHGSSDCWVVKISSYDGGIIWQKTLGGIRGDGAYAIIKTSDGNLVIAGNSYSNDGDVSGNHGNLDAWVVKISSNDGRIIWQKTLGGSDYDSANSIIETSDGSFVVAGETYSNDGDVSGNHGGFDYWVVKISPDDGGIIWQKTLGGSKDDYANSIIETSDGNLVVAGYSISNDGDVSGNHAIRGYDDYWVVKISAGLSILQKDYSDSVFSIVEPMPDAENIDMGKVLVGMGKDSVISKFMKNIGSYPFRVDSIYITGADAAAFSLVAGIPQYTINANSSHHAEFHFAPKEARVYNANIVIITQSDTLTRTITGEGIEPFIDITTKLLDFGRVELGSERTFQDTLLITNASIGTIAIDSVYMLGPDKLQFITISGGGKFDLAPNESRKLSVKFKPNWGGRTSGRLAFAHNGFGSPAIVQLFGTGIGGVLKVTSDSAYAGEKKTFHVSLENIKPEGLAELASSYELKLKFQKTILGLRKNADCEFTTDSVYLNLKGAVTASADIASFDATACLGNVSETSIDIVSTILKDKNGDVIDYNFEYESGLFNLLGICQEGGTRLFSSSGKAQILAISPNPANDKITVNVNSIENGSSFVIIYNSLGEEVATANLNDKIQGAQSIDFDASAFPNGVYLIKYQTPTYSEYAKVLINK